MMEARRLEKQRRESAKSKAASQLPSSQEQEFNLRLVDLYREQPCLWNTLLPEYKDAELKGRAWEEIAAKMGTHLTAAFVRCRMRSLRYKLNLYQLQAIEFQMVPGAGKVPPEKPYFLDRMGFLEAVSSKSEESPKEERAPKTSKPSNIGSGKLSDLWSGFDRKQPLEAFAKLSTKEAPAPHRLSDPSIATMVKQRLESHLRILEFATPRITIPRLQRPSRQTGQTSSSETPPELLARPGESISETKLAWQRRMQQEQQQEQQLGGGSDKPSTSRDAREFVESEDEELYSLHWRMRRQQRSLRQGGQDPAPLTLPAGLRSTRANEPNPDIF